MLLEMDLFLHTLVVFFPADTWWIPTHSADFVSKHFYTIPVGLALLSAEYILLMYAYMYAAIQIPDQLETFLIKQVTMTSPWTLTVHPCTQTSKQAEHN